MHAPRWNDRLGLGEVAAPARAARVLRRAALVVLLAPGALVAQRGGGIGGFGRGRGPGNLARESGLVVPKQVNPINLLIEHRPELGLSDSVFKRVIAMKRTLDSTNAPTMRRLDSLERLFRGGTPMFSEPSAARQDSIAEGRRLMNGLLVEVRDNNAVAREKAYALLNEQQLVQAQALEAKAEKALEAAESKKP